MSKGFVYVLTNPAMPGLVKIGMTTRAVEQRVEELYQTGVPARFVIVDQVLAPDCASLERWVHEAFAQYRVSDQREFFSVPPAEAAAIMKRGLLIQLHDWVNEFAPGFTVSCESFVSRCEGYLEFWADDAGITFDEAVDALPFIENDDVKRALARRDELHASARARHESEIEGNIVRLPIREVSNNG